MLIAYAFGVATGIAACFGFYHYGVKKHITAEFEKLKAAIVSKLH